MITAAIEIIDRVLHPIDLFSFRSIAATQVAQVIPLFDYVICLVSAIKLFIIPRDN